MVLASDLPYSSREELEQRGDRYYFHACNHHRAMYENHASKKTCVIEGCENESKVTKGGLRLCKLHATKEERVKKDSRTSRDAVPLTDDPPRHTVDMTDEVVSGPGKPEARFAPGVTPNQNTEGLSHGEKTSRLKYEELGQYLRLLMQGATQEQALEEVTPASQDRKTSWAELRKAATEYLPILPEDYPQTARKGIVDLVAGDMRLPAERPLDPVLDLDHPETLQRPLRARGRLSLDPGFLLKLGEDHGYAWPPHAIFSVWEELWARFTEEMKELDRNLRREMREEAPSFDRIRFFATSPDFNGDPWLTLPRTFFLEDEGEYFQTDVVPRHNRLLSRACWQTALRRNLVLPLTGGKAGAEEHGMDDPRSEALVSRPDPRVGKGAGKDGPKLLGPALTGKEGARALDRRPKDKKTGKFLCWDNITHRGCKAAACVHYHGPAPKWDSMDWSVQLQLLRRGGLKNKPSLSGEQVAKQMEQIRQAQKDKMAENVADGKKQKASGKGKDKDRVAGQEPQEEQSKVGQDVPEEFRDFTPTEAEEKLANWTQGAGSTFFVDQDAHRPCREVGEEVTDAPEAKARLEHMKSVDDSGLTAMLEGDLATFVNNRLLLHKERDPGVELGQALVRKYVEEARDSGCPELSAHADQVLTNGTVGKVGFSLDTATLSPMVWKNGVGRGAFRYRNAVWEVYDYGDQLPISKELVELLTLDDVQCQREESRQCLYLHCSAGVLMARHGKPPSLQDVQEATSRVRADAVWQAQEAAYHLGPCPEEVGKAEADLRTFAHDILKLDHDKGYRCLAAFPPSFFEGCTLQIVRMDPHGAVTIETIKIPSVEGPELQVWLLVSRGHMRLLGKPGVCDVPKIVREVEAAGWEVHLEAVEGPEACVRARDLSKCPRCDEAAGDPLRIGERGPTTLGLYPLPNPEQKIGGWTPGR